MTRRRTIVLIVVVAAATALTAAAVMEARRRRAIGLEAVDDIEARLDELDPVTRAAVVAKVGRDTFSKTPTPS
jgi:hypothetical protein